MEILSFGKVNESNLRRIVSATGQWVVDTNGNRYFDSMSGLWCVPLGYSQESIKVKMSEQLQMLPFYHNFFHTQTEVSYQLTKRFEQLFPENKWIYYSCSGSAANEIALKIALRYFEKTGRPKQNGFVYMQHSYHGTSLGVSQVSDQNMIKFTGARVSFPSWRCDVNEFNHQQTLKNLEDLLEQKRGEIAGLIIEPVIGAGGVIGFDKSFFSGLSDLRAKYGFKVILDEVVTGFGKTGSLFACNHLEFRADIVTLGKAMTNGYFPLAATLMSDELISETVRWFNHGYTFSSHPVGAAACLETLRLMESILPESQQVIGFFKDEIQKVSHSRLRHIRVQNCMGALVFDRGVSCTELEELAWLNGIIVRGGSGDPNVICFCLPITSSREEIVHFVSALQNILNQFKGDKK